MKSEVDLNKGQTPDTKEIELEFRTKNPNNEGEQLLNPEKKELKP